MRGRVGQLAAAVVALGVITGATRVVEAQPTGDVPDDPRWQRSEITLWLDGSRPQQISLTDIRAALTRAARAWQRAGAGCGAPRIKVAGVLDKRRSERDGASVVVFREDAWCRNGDPRDGCHDPDAVALTFAHASGGELIEADIAVNGIHHRWAAVRGELDARRWDHLDLQNVFTHELGHLLGLSDNCTEDKTDTADRPSCFTEAALLQRSAMYPLGTAGQLTRRTISASDRSALCALYRRPPGEFASVRRSAKKERRR